jgi:hypothetical protein
MSERVRSTELRIHVKHVFGFGGLPVAESVFEHFRQAVIHQDHTVVCLNQAACDRRCNFAGEMFVLREQLDFLFGEIAVIQTVTH